LEVVPEGLRDVLARRRAQLTPGANRFLAADGQADRPCAVGQRRHLHAEGAMSVEDNKQSARRFYEEVINARNLDALGSC